jgi:DNA-directed RNA polymerase specialized sigma subunit
MFSICIDAQVNKCSNIGIIRGEDYPEQIREKLTELCIKEAKDDFQQLLDRGQEIAKLTDELEISFAKNKGFTSVDREKIERVENLLKKIRKDLQADDDDNDEKESKPQSLIEAVRNLKEKTSDLFEELKKTSRYSISAVAIQSSNTILKLVRFIKKGN